MTPPSPWITRFASLVAPGARVLDLAAGSGRHARHFLDRDHPVLALDRDVSRLADLAGTANCEIVEADLEDGSAWPLPGHVFGGVVVSNYLYRPIMAAICDAVGTGGLLIYETFALGNEAFGRPSNPDFLLRPGELLEAVAGQLEVIAYEHGRVDRPAPAIVQRIAARRDNDPATALL